MRVRGRQHPPHPHPGWGSIPPPSSSTLPPDNAHHRHARVPIVRRSVHSWVRLSWSRSDERPHSSLVVAPAPLGADSTALPSPRPREVTRMRIFSGIKPTGDPTLGNYSGGFRQYTTTQELGDAFFCIVDLHAITVEYDPRDLHERTLDMAAMLFATGLDPDRSTVFAQSHVSAHAEAAWLLGAVTSYGQLGRMTQFKEKGTQQDFVSAALFNYPILMAGDILLYRADQVPIGDDQRQHLELARDIAERFNTRFGELFVVPEGVYPTVGARIMDLQDPTGKMGK